MNEPQTPATQSVLFRTLCFVAVPVAPSIMVGSIACGVIAIWVAPDSVRLWTSLFVAGLALWYAATGLGLVMVVVRAAPGQVRRRALRGLAFSASIGALGLVLLYGAVVMFRILLAELARLI